MKSDDGNSIDLYTISEVKRHGHIMMGTKIPVGRDPETGKVRQFSYVKHTSEEVLDAIRSDSYSPLHGAIQNKLCTDITIGELADRFWEAKYAFWSSNTRYNKKVALEWIKRFLNDLPAIELSAMRAELFQSELILAEDGPTCNSINLIMQLLSSIIEFAKGEQVPVFNTVKYVKSLPKVEQRRVLPDVSQIKTFLESMKVYDVYFILTMLLISLGIRFGECISLTEDDILFDQQLIRINKHIIWDRENAPFYHTQLKQSRKMNDSYYVTLPEISLSYINQALSLQKEQMVKLGASYNNEMKLILTDENGEKIRHYKYYSRYRYRAKKCGIPSLSPHDMRRIVAINIYKETRDIRAVQNVLGHIQPFSSAMYIMSLKQPDAPITFTADEAYRHLAEELP